MFAAISNLLHIPYTWLTKLMYLGILVVIWNTALGANQTSLIILNNYVLNLTVFRILPQTSIIEMEQLVILFLTWHLLVWIFSHERHGAPTNHHN